MSENNVLSEEIVNDVINQCIDNYTNDKNEEKIETHTDKEDNNEVEINEEFAPEDYAYDEKDIESKKIINIFLLNNLLSNQKFKLKMHC